MATIDELLGKFPEMDPVLLRCIKLLQVGGKEGRKGIKDMTNELFTTRSASPLTTVQAKSDKRKAAQAIGQSEKKPRMELESGFDLKSDNTSNTPFNPEKGGSVLSTASSSTSSESCKTCGDPSIKGKQGLKVECSECHQYFHQECHKPPVPTSTASDPRTIWKCSSCAESDKSSNFVNPKSRKSEEKNKDKSVDSVPSQRVDKLSAKKDIDGKSREGSPSLSGWGNLIKGEKKKNETKLTSVDIFAADSGNETAKPKKSKYKDSLAEDGDSKDDKKLKKKKKKKSQQ